MKGIFCGKRIWLFVLKFPGGKENVVLASSRRAIEKEFRWHINRGAELREGNFSDVERIANAKEAVSSLLGWMFSFPAARFRRGDAFVIRLSHLREG